MYEESVGIGSVGRPTKMNDLDLCLEVESRSCQPLRCKQRSLSRKPLEIVAWFQRTTNRKWPIGSTVGYPSDSLASYFYFLLFSMCHYAVNWCDKVRLPFPIGGPLEPSLYLYRFLDLLGPKHIAIS